MVRSQLWQRFKLSPLPKCRNVDAKFNRVRRISHAMLYEEESTRMFEEWKGGTVGAIENGVAWQDYAVRT